MKLIVQFGTLHTYLVYIHKVCFCVCVCVFPCVTNSGTLAKVLSFSKLGWEVATPSLLDCEDGEYKDTLFLSYIFFLPSLCFFGGIRSSWE